MLLALPVLVLIGALVRHRVAVARADALWQTHRPAALGDIGTTRRLEILPLVDLFAARDGLATDVGVSYLVRTDEITILFDTGNHSDASRPSPLTTNMEALGVTLDEVDAVVISHAHFDHVGGRRWTDGAISGTTFGIGDAQPPLGDRRVITSIPMRYPGSRPEAAPEPMRLARGVATTGTIARQLFGGWIDEQALAIHVEGRGIVLVVGCGHQTLTRLIERTEAVFDAPLHGIVGGLHYPVPEGRITMAGFIDAQRRLGSGDGPYAPLDRDDVDRELAMLEARHVELVSIGGHDSSDEVIADARARFGAAYRDLRVGEAIVVEAPPAP